MCLVSYFRDATISANVTMCMPCFKITLLLNESLTHSRKLSFHELEQSDFSAPLSRILLCIHQIILSLWGNVFLLLTHSSHCNFRLCSFHAVLHQMTICFVPHIYIIQYLCMHGSTLVIAQGNVQGPYMAIFQCHPFLPHMLGSWTFPSCLLVMREFKLIRLSCCV